MTEPTVLSLQARIHELEEKVKSWKPDSTGAAAVGNYYWQPMDTCPRGVKVQLLGRSGVAVYGQYHPDPFWTDWAPLPKRSHDRQSDKDASSHP